jgi:hypothetical protein
LSFDEMKKPKKARGKNQSASKDSWDCLRLQEKFTGTAILTQCAGEEI